MKVDANTLYQWRTDKARNIFGLFAKYVNPRLEFAQFHIVYYRILHRFATGKIKKLIISMPPQHGKSEASTRLLPAIILGRNPDARIAVASYNDGKAKKFNREIQRYMRTPQYAELFPDTRISNGRTSSEDAINTANEFEIIGHRGSLLSVGRGGGLTGNPVDVLIIDDLYKDAEEGNSPVIRESCWEWYASVANFRLHNDSRQLIVFTRWHEDDLIGRLEKYDKVIEVDSWAQLDDFPADAWAKVNFQAIKESEPTEIDPRRIGEALWPVRHSLERLQTSRRLSPEIFECMCQGNPYNESGALYGREWQTYTELPATYGNNNYTDIADTGTDNTLSISYRVGATETADGMSFRKCYITDLVYTGSDLDEAEKLLPMLFSRTQTRSARIESNNGGRYFAHKLKARCPGVEIIPFFQSQNKESRILTYAPTVKQCIVLPYDWAQRWPRFYADATSFKRIFKANAHDEVADVLTGIAECENGDRKRPRGVKVRN